MENPTRVTKFFLRQIVEADDCKLAGDSVHYAYKGTETAEKYTRIFKADDNVYSNVCKGLITSTTLGESNNVFVLGVSPAQLVGCIFDDFAFKLVNQMYDMALLLRSNGRFILDITAHVVKNAETKSLLRPDDGLLFSSTRPFTKANLESLTDDMQKLRTILESTPIDESQALVIALTCIKPMDNNPNKCNVGTMRLIGIPATSGDLVEMANDVVAHPLTPESPAIANFVHAIYSLEEDKEESKSDFDKLLSGALSKTESTSIVVLIDGENAEQRAELLQFVHLAIPVAEKVGKEIVISSFDKTPEIEEVFRENAAFNEESIRATLSRLDSIDDEEITSMVHSLGLTDNSLYKTTTKQFRDLYYDSEKRFLEYQVKMEKKHSLLNKCYEDAKHEVGKIIKEKERAQRRLEKKAEQLRTMMNNVGPLEEKLNEINNLVDSVNAKVAAFEDNDEMKIKDKYQKLFDFFLAEREKHFEETSKHNDIKKADEARQKEMEDTLAEQEKQNAKLVEDRKNLELKVSALEADKVTLVAELDSAKNNLNEILEEKQRLEQELAGTNTKLEEKTNEAKSLNETIEGLNAASATSASNLETVQKNLDETAEQLKLGKEKIAELESQMKAQEERFEEEKKTLKQEVETAENAHNKFAAENSVRTAELNKEKADLEGRLAEMGKNIELLSKTKEELEDTKKKLGQMDAQLKSVKDQQGKSEQEIAALKKKHTDAENEKAVLLGDNKKLKTEVDKLKAEVGNAKTQAAEAKADKNKIHTLEEQIEKLKRSEKEATEKHSKEKKALEDKCANMADKCEKLNMEVNGLKQKCKEEQDKKADYVAPEVHAKTEDDLQKTRGELQKGAEDLQKVNEELDKTREELKKLEEQKKPSTAGKNAIMAVVATVLVMTGCGLGMLLSRRVAK